MPRTNYWAKLEPGNTYHIYNHANGKENLFFREDNFRYFWSRWNHFISPYFDNYAFCLMPNHFHVVSRAKPLSEELLSTIEKETSNKALAYLKGDVAINVFYESQFKRFFTSYTGSINKQEQRMGSLFKSKFRRTFIKDESALKYFIEYLHHNPIHHAFYTDYGEWKHDSFRYFITDETIDGLNTASVLEMYGSVELFLKAHAAFKENFRKA